AGGRGRRGGAGPPPPRPAPGRCRRTGRAPRGGRFRRRPALPRDPVAGRGGPRGGTAEGPGRVVERPGDPEPGARLRVRVRLRRRQLGFYAGKIDGDYTAQVKTSVSTYQWTRGIQADEPGVYDTPTRAKLESETSEP